VKQDYVEAARWYRKAADQGHAGAQNNLGYMYCQGQGVPQDYAEAARWFRKAADQGDAEAQYNLGIMYDQGQGVPQDYVQAHMWLNLAAAHSNGADQQQYSQPRELVANKMTQAQVAEAQRLAREWKPDKLVVDPSEVLAP
jgi:TPR repeat protein